MSTAPIATTTLTRVGTELLAQITDLTGSHDITVAAVGAGHVLLVDAVPSTAAEQVVETFCADNAAFTRGLALHCIDLAIEDVTKLDIEMDKAMARTYERNAEIYDQVLAEIQAIEAAGTTDDEKTAARLAHKNRMLAAAKHACVVLGNDMAA